MVDTPGFGDSSGRDNQLIEEMMEILDTELGKMIEILGTELGEMMKILDTELGYTNVIMLLIDGNTPRLSSGLYDMLRQMSSIFWETWWDFMMVGVSKWKYSQAAIDERQAECDFYGDPSEYCKNEDWFRRELTAQLREKFDITKDFTFAFMDSFSQSGPSVNDDIQQQHWMEETLKLWEEATGKNETFDFQTIDKIDDVLEENVACKEENLRLRDIIDDNITQLFSAVNENKQSIDENVLKIDELEEEMDVVANMPLQEVPIGTILAWVLKVDKDDTGDNTVDLPDGWLRCDGSTIPHHNGSIWAGQRVCRT